MDSGERHHRQPLKMISVSDLGSVPKMVRHFGPIRAQVSAFVQCDLIDFLGSNSSFREPNKEEQQQ